MREEDIISMLDNLTEKEVSRIKIKMDENSDNENPVREYHHGRCDIGSPWAKGIAFDVLE